LVTATITNRVGGYTVDDVIPPFAGFDPAATPAPFAVQRTGHLHAGAGVRLTQAAVSIYRWTGHGYPVGPPTPGVARVRADGVDVVYPSAPGRYVLSFIVGWQTTCLKGDGTASIAIDSSLPATDALGPKDARSSPADLRFIPLAASIGFAAMLLVGRRRRRAPSPGIR
jgi:hypothetical protein